MTIWNKRILIVLSLIMVLLMVSAKSALAASMPDLTSETSTLKIETKYTDEDKTTNIGGMELTIYKVADLAVSGGNTRYTLTKDFEASGVDLNNLTTEGAIDATQKFQEVVTSNKPEGNKAVSQDGVADFGQVSNGAYLVVQTGATEEAEKYGELSPYLLLAPQPLTEIGEEDWNYDVVSIPKTVLAAYEEVPPGENPPKEEEVKDAYDEDEEESEVKEAYEEDEKKVKSAKTGDDNLILVCSLAVVMAACIIGVFAIRRRRESE